MRNQRCMMIQTSGQFEFFLDLILVLSKSQSWCFHWAFLVLLYILHFALLPNQEISSPTMTLCFSLEWRVSYRSQSSIKLARGIESWAHWKETQALKFRPTEITNSRFVFKNCVTSCSSNFRELDGSRINYFTLPRLCTLETWVFTQQKSRLLSCSVNVVTWNALLWASTKSNEYVQIFF